MTYDIEEIIMERDELKQQLANATKQNVMLRNIVEQVTHIEPLVLVQDILKALAATATDLEGSIICDAEPVFLFRRKGISKDFCTCDEKRFLELSHSALYETKKLYKARSTK